MSDINDEFLAALAGASSGFTPELDTTYAPITPDYISPVGEAESVYVGSEGPILYDPNKTYNEDGTGITRQAMAAEGTVLAGSYQTAQTPGAVPSPVPTYADIQAWMRQLVTASAVDTLPEPATVSVPSLGAGLRHYYTESESLTVVWDNVANQWVQVAKTV